MEKKEMTAWELLRQTSEIMDEVVDLTVANKPDEETTERIQQALIVAMIAISTFSQHLADDDIHEIIRKEVLQ